MVDQRVGDILAGSTTSPEEIGTLTKELKAALHFATARKLLGVRLNLFPRDVWMQQQLALRTYKDELLHLGVLHLPFEPGMGAPEFRSHVAALVGSAIFPFMGCISAAATLGR